LEISDFVLVMSVNPGFGGQKFIPGTHEKIRQLKELRTRYNYAYRIEVDGGVDMNTAPELVRSGADILVAGTAVFHAGDASEAVRQLRQITAEALAQKV
jgi:ribulose-phosphate 3-epimerase